VDVARAIHVFAIELSEVGTISEQRRLSLSAPSSAEDECMQFDDSKSGDHLETGPDEAPAVVSNIPERQGVTGHNIRYVLFFGLAAVIIAFTVILVSYLT
jgi:hypothetical protein